MQVYGAACHPIFMQNLCSIWPEGGATSQYSVFIGRSANRSLNVYVMPVPNNELQAQSGKHVGQNLSRFVFNRKVT